MAIVKKDNEGSRWPYLDRVRARSGVHDMIYMPVGRFTSKILRVYQN